MKSTLKFGIAALGAVLLQAGAHAAAIVDQSNVSVGSGFCYTGITNSCGQSFKQDHGNIAGAGVHINAGWGAGDGTLTISIYSAYSGALNAGDLIAQGTSGTISSESGWVDVFWSPAAVTAGNTYYMVLSSTQDYLVASYDDFGNYANGNALVYGDTTSWSQFDLSFVTYYDNGNDVPVPGSLALLGLGLAGLGFARRRA